MYEEKDDRHLVEFITKPSKRKRLFAKKKEAAMRCSFSHM